MNKQQITAIAAVAVALTQITGCSKTSGEPDAAFKAALAARDKRIAELDMKQSQSQPAPDRSDRAISSNAAERIVEIDRLLSAPLTGRADDSDRRATLRAERAALVGGSYARAVDQSVVRRDQPAASRQNTNIVVARDSQGDHNPHHMSALEAMTPTERKHYYRELRILNPNPIVGGSYYPDKFRSRYPRFTSDNPAWNGKPLSNNPFAP